ncbi:ABC transporter ATP-binding protein [Chitinophaga filiformis]|uniref:Osmoprotectant transport system ATP-binding protein n=1 Tax=Chitinophaga filiformis TaxID=104663 RepID=A0A1G7N6J2_CHIFI|nr:ATP-binding cassette domain-containing protein [Chitinophaga filiformis]SDF69675.1 osmoprotectant transport system ATP-binding protein [Chitinophaga filiformis]
MIKLEHVNKSFHNGKPAVRDVSFEVNKGETLVLLGTSGSGKTTTLRMINRLIAPDSGQILVNGAPINTQQIEALRRNIGYVLQDNGLFPHYTVAENIGIVPTLLKWDKKRIEERTHSLMEKLRLSVADHYDVYPQQLSGGQQQRVGLARALAADPSILLMDEPFGALDPVTRASVRKEFRSLDEIRNKTVIMVTHDVPEAFELGNRICLMDKGVIQQTGTPAELLFNPANDFVSSFFHEQRFWLELNALRLTDIRPWLGNTAPGENHAPVLKGENTCWDALEQLTTLSAPVNISFDDKLVRIDTSELMHAFTQHKQTVSGHGRSTRLS